MTDVEPLEDKASCFPDSLVCSLCLDIFQDATLLSCGHTFCRKCLENYDLSHRDAEDMVCPLCRSSTNLDENRVEGLPANVSVKGLVDDYHYQCNQGVSLAAPEFQQRCTTCKVKAKAVSFCKECKSYMCESCQDGHERMAAFFGDHEVIPLSDIHTVSGASNIYKYPERCPVHKMEFKDMFCEECKVCICCKCVIAMHRDHTIRNKADIEKELWEKGNELIGRCRAKKTELEKNTEHTKWQRQEVRGELQRLEAEVREAYEKKAKQLDENERVLLEDLQSLQKAFEGELEILKAQHQRRIKSITGLASLLLANDRLGLLEADSLTAHTQLCYELEQTLNEIQDDEAIAETISKTAGAQMFRPSDENLLALGEIVTCPEIQVIKEIA